MIHMATYSPHCQCDSWTWVAACKCLVDIDPIRMSKRLRVTLRDALAAIKVPILDKGPLDATIPLAGIAFIWTFATVKSPTNFCYHLNTFTLQCLWAEYLGPLDIIMAAGSPSSWKHVPQQSRAADPPRCRRGSSW